jgi:hypothetical protein
VTTHSDRTQGYLLIALATLLVTLAAALAFSAATADKASAQGAAICQQYPSLPQCQSPSSGGGGNQGSGEAGAIPGGGGPTAGEQAGAKGELPFTGYPLTPLLLLFLILLVAGLTIRSYLAIRDRLRARDSGTPTGTA